MNNFPSNSMYYRHGGRSHEAHSQGSIGGGGSRQQFWSDSFSPYSKSVDQFRQHGNFSSQSAWQQHQSFQQQWPHGQWMSQNHQSGSFRKDQGHGQKHSFKGSHHQSGSYKYKKSFGNYERSSDHKEGSSSAAHVKEEDPLPGSEEERKKMLAQETDKVKKCLMTFKNELSTNAGSSDNKEKEKNSSDASSKDRGKVSEPNIGAEHHDNKEKGKSSSHASSPSQKNVSSKEKDKQGAHSASGTRKQQSHSVNSSGHATSKNVASNSSEGSAKHAKKPSHSHKQHSSGSHGGKASYSLNSKDNNHSLGASSNVHSSSKSEVKNVQHNKNAPQASVQLKKNRSSSNSGTKQTASSGAPKQVHTPSAANTSSEGESSKPCLNECTEENNVQAKIKHLKDHIVRHILGMTPNSLKDFVNKPTSRRFEFAMKHLVKERQELVSREQRGLANSRIHTQSTGSLDEGEVQNENVSLDTNVSVNLASLPPEVIEYLGNLLQVDLLKCVEEPSTSEESARESYSDCIVDFENLKAFANALPNNENIFALIEEKPGIAEFAIKQEVVCPWEDVAETNNSSGQSAGRFDQNSEDHIPQSELQEIQISQNDNFDTGTNDHVLHSELQESQVCENDQGDEVTTIVAATTPVSLPQWTDNQNRFHVLDGHQHCAAFSDDIDGWNKTVSADLTLQSLELTEKLIDKIEQMTTENAQNGNVSESAKNDSADKQSNELVNEMAEPVAEEEDSANFEEVEESNLNEERLLLSEEKNSENQNLKEVVDTGSASEIDTETVPLDNEKQPDESKFDNENICSTEIVESQKQDEDDINILDGKDNRVSDDIEIIPSEGNTSDKNIEIITIPDDESIMESQRKELDVQRETAPHKLFDSSDEKMEVDESHSEENLSSRNGDLASDDVQLEEPQVGPELKNVESFVQVLEPSSSDYLQTEEPMEEGALIHDKSLASAIIPEAETCEETPVSLSPMEAKFPSMSTITEDLVTAPNLSVELGDCASSTSGLFSQGLNQLDDGARSLVENGPADCKLLKESDKEWSVCGATEIPYGHQGSGNAEFRNLFCELPDLEPEPADGEQQCQGSIAPDEVVEPNPSGSCGAGTGITGTRTRSASCSAATAAHVDHPVRFSPVHVQVESEQHVAVEVSTQTDLEGEVTPHNVERMLQMLEKSHQLSPQLTKLLRDHFTLINKGSQEKHYEPCRMSRESRREMWNGNKRDNKVKQTKVYSQPGGRINIPNYVCSRSINEASSLMESNVEKTRENEESRVIASPQEDSEETATDVEKTIFLEMLGIDKEIQRLMDQKLRLYMRLRLNMSGERLNVGHYSPRTPPPQERMSSQLCSMSTPISPILDVPADENELSQKGRTIEQSVEKTLLRPPVVILPHSYEKPSYGESGDNADNVTCAPMLDAIFPRITGVNKRLKLMDTTVVEQVLNSFTIPDSQDKSAGLKPNNNLQVLGNMTQNENYSIVGKETLSDCSHSTVVVDQSSQNAVDVCESRESDDLSNSSSIGKPRTKKNKAQSKYMSEKVDIISSENLQSVSESRKTVPGEIPAGNSPSHLISHSSKSLPSSKSDTDIVNNSRSSQEFSVASVSATVPDTTEVPSSEISVSTSESAANEKCVINDGEFEAPLKSPKEISGDLSEKTLLFDKHNKKKAISSDTSAACSKKVKLAEDKALLLEDSDTKSVDKVKLALSDDSVPLSKTEKSDSLSREKRLVANTDTTPSKATRRRSELIPEPLASDTRRKARSNAVKETLLSDKADKSVDESLSSDKVKLAAVKEGSLSEKHIPLPTETASNNSVKVAVAKQRVPSAEKYSQKSKVSVSDQNTKVINEKPSKSKPPSNEKDKTSSSTKSNKSNKNDVSSEKYSRRSRLTKSDREESISPVKATPHSKAGRLDSDKGFSDQSESSVSTDVTVSPRKSSSRSKTAMKRSPERNLKEKQVVPLPPVVPPVEVEISRTRRKGKKLPKTDENVDSAVEEGHVSLPSHKEELSPKRTKKTKAAKAHDGDGKQMEPNKEEKVTPTRRGKQSKVNDAPVQSSADFTKPNSTPKKPAGRSRKAKESLVRAASATESESESVGSEVRKSSVESLDRSCETTTRNKRKRCRAMEEEVPDGVPPSKRTKIKETRTSVCEDDQDASLLQSKRSTRLRRTSSRLESDQHGTSSDASDNTQSSGRRSLVRSARVTKSYIDVPVDDEILEDSKKKRSRRLSHCESVKSEVSVMQVVEDTEHCSIDVVPPVESQENSKAVDDIPCVSDRDESLAAPDLTVKNCRVFLTRIRVDSVAVSEENDEETDDNENEPLSYSLSGQTHERSGALLSDAALPGQEEEHSGTGDASPNAGLPAAELRSDWAELQARHPADGLQSDCCTPSYAAADGCPDPQLLQSFQVESMAMDDNSISTLVSDSVSMMSDGEQKKGRSENTDCDHDSTHSAETMADSTSSQSSRHKTSRKHRREKKSDTPEHLTFETHAGPILHIKTVGRHVLAACEDGAVYSYSLKSGKFKGKYEGHTAAVTCLYVLEFSPRTGGETPSDVDGEHETPAHVFTGSLDHYLRGFVFRTGEAVFDPQCIGSPIQCMDHNWGYLYMGTKLGDVARFNIQKSCLIGDHLKLSSESILSLIATKEGPRKVLIIGTRSSPIMVRDATNGLLLRSVSSHWGHTAYSLLLENSLVYCGTSTDAIRVFEFTSGKEVCQLKAGCSVVCMTSYNNMLFAGCYDGNIYVFGLQDKKHITTIAGPGKMLLCMDIVKNRVIAGCKEGNKLEAWSFPSELKTIAKEAKHR